MKTKYSIGFGLKRPGFYWLIMEWLESGTVRLRTNTGSYYSEKKFESNISVIDGNRNLWLDRELIDFVTLNFHRLQKQDLAALSRLIELNAESIETHIKKLISAELH